MSTTQKTLWDDNNRSEWLDYTEAREFARTLGLKSEEDWGLYLSKQFPELLQLPKNIPDNPDLIYRHLGWLSWDDWLGIEKEKTVSPKIPTNLFDITPEGNLMSFSDARNKAREYGFEYKEEWEAFVSGKFHNRPQLPDEVPNEPDVVYRLFGWKGWKNWLVPPEGEKEYSTFTESREFTRCLRLNDKSTWRTYFLSDNPQHKDLDLIIPEKPDLEYQDQGWIDWDDWLGNNINYKDFKSTRKFIRTLKLKSYSKWKDYCCGQISDKNAKPENIYAYPDIAYKEDGWLSWDDWLGLEESDINIDDPALNNETQECRCKGLLKDCPVCDGKGYYYKKRPNF